MSCYDAAWEMDFQMGEGNEFVTRKGMSFINQLWVISFEWASWE
jgi:hypothetical protein